MCFCFTRNSRQSPPPDIFLSQRIAHAWPTRIGGGRWVSPPMKGRRMTAHTCSNCLHYAPTRSTETGRILPSKPGRCQYPVLRSPIPQCYDHLENVVAMARIPVWPEYGDKCKCFSPKTERERAVEAKAETLL